MYIYALAFAAAAILAFTGTKALDLRFGGRSLADRLTNPGRAHDRPYVGGMVVFAVLCLVPAVAVLVSADAADSMEQMTREVVGFYLATGLLFLAGVYDDLRVAHFLPKLGAQVAAAVILIIAGWRIDAIGLPWDASSELGILGPAITLLWIVGLTNAMNLIDGKDGVAVGVAALAGATIAATAIKADLWFVGVQLTVLTAAAIGFLPHNFPPARRFLGDSGAMLLGFGLAALSIRSSESLGAVHLSIPALALGFPIVDTILAFVRRPIDHKNPFKGDLDHIHHRLEVKFSLGPRGILLLLYGLAALFSGGALIIRFVGGPLAQGFVFGFFALVIVFILRRLGYFGSMWNGHHVLRLRRVIRRREELPIPEDYREDAAPPAEISQPALTAVRGED